AIAFAKCKKKVHKKVHRKDKKNCSRDTRYNAAARVADSQRGRNANNDETGPRQGEAVLQMSAKWREQCSGKIRIKAQILPEFRQTQEFCSFICAAQPERSFAPVLNFQRRINLLIDDVPRLVVMDDSGILQLPGFGFRAVNSASCNIICHDVVVGVLLKHLNVIERIAALKKILNEPRAQVRPVTKNLSLDGATGTRLRLGNEYFPRQFRVRCQRIVERHACRNREQAHADQWQQNTLKTYACREHRNDLVGTRHSAESEKQRQQQ